MTQTAEPSTDEANARLIAAAPDLLAACQAVLNQITMGWAPQDETRTIAWCAIQLARVVAIADGRTP